ncbi:MAG: PD-(D/E)XK nuclease family protein [Alphaproteobacteria bacterium]|nr:PD-(D/E)XK nuclease family protein [Alphaproteobacteria bacterium]
MTIHEILELRKKKKMATAHGAAIHKQLQAAAPMEQIRAAGIERMFDEHSRAEVPIAGNINGKFISRRIDRLRITPDKIEFLDYKTDADKSERMPQYTAQMREYAALLSAAYPGRSTAGYILWLCDWTLEKVV